MPQCTAHSKRSGEQCKNQAVPGHRTCRMHSGGRGGRPIIHGRRSKLYQNLRILEAVDEIRSDPEILSHRENVVMLEALIARAAEEKAQPPASWRKALELCEKALKGEVSALSALYDHLSAGLEGSEHLDRLLELAEQQRKHRESESKREAMLDQGLTARQAHMLVSSLLTIIQDEVKDHGARNRIGHKFARIMRGEDRARALPDPAGG